MTTRSIVLVTGGNTGLGYEIVKSLMESDRAYHILMGSRSVDKARTAIDELRKECPKSSSEVEPVQVDLASDVSVQKAYEQIKSSPGRIDTLINNAGARLQLSSRLGCPISPSLSPLTGGWLF